MPFFLHQDAHNQRLKVETTFELSRSNLAHSSASSAQLRALWMRSGSPLKTQSRSCQEKNEVAVNFFFNERSREVTATSCYPPGLQEIAPMKPLATLFAILVLGARPLGAAVDPSLLQDLRYRLIGPFRASRTVGGVGVPTQPGVFHVGVNNGWVWKTDDYGRTWSPLFDDAPTGSIGDIAVSPSHPDVIYVGTGEGLHRPDLSVGDGIFKSTDGGDTWAHVGLKDVQQVGRIVVHPENSDIVFVAGMGHPYGANEERGVFRTTSGGRTWEKVLYIDRNTGASAVELDPSDPRTIFAGLWEHREGPWENGSFSGPGTGLYKSTDGGSTWRRLTNGLPADDWGPLFIGIAPGDSKRVYVTLTPPAAA